MKTQASPATSLLVGKDHSQSWNREISAEMQPVYKGHVCPICLEEVAKMEAV